MTILSKLKILLFYACFFSYTGITAQNAFSKLQPLLKLTKTTHFTESDFNGDSQFWTMCRNTDGIYFFGNNDGVLVYDGETWQKITLPNNSSVRSIIHASDGKIYAGGYNEMGVISKNEFGKYHYNSILSQLPLDDKNLENVWQIHELDQTLIFRTFKGLIARSNASSTYIPSSSTFTFSSIVNAMYLVQDLELGVMTFNPKTKRLSSLFEPHTYNNEKIVAFLPSNNKDLIEIITDVGSIYEGNIKTKSIKKWATIFPENQKEFIAVALKSEDSYILGTISSKVLTFSRTEKRIKTPITFNDIQDATVLNLYKDQNNLWVLLNNGLDFITYNPTASQLFNAASVYDILFKEQTLYLATNKGVYYSSINDALNRIDFKRLDSPQGQTWSLSSFNNTILISHDKGLFELEDLKTTQLGTVSGFWKVISVPNNPDTFLACSYNGLYVLKHQDNSFKFIRKIEGFDESTRDILPAKEDNTFWVCHGYKGIYKIKLDDDYKRVYAIDHFTDQNGLTSQFNINVHRWNSELIFTTNTGIYTYNNSKNSFIPHKTLNSIIDTTINTRKVIQDSTKTWVVLNNEIGYFKTQDQSPEIFKNSFLNVKNKLNRGLEVILPVSRTNVFVGAKNGLYVYNLDIPEQKSVKTTITGVTRQDHASKNAIPVQLSSSKNKPVTISHTTDAIKFYFAAPKLNPDNTIKYSCKLSNLDKKWSVWSELTNRQYNHLKPGDYTFCVKSMDLNGNKGTIAAYHFSINPVWYETQTAFIFYVLLSLVLIWVIYKLISKKIAVEKRKTVLASEKSKRLLELEIQQLKLKQDKSILEKNVLLKSKELTNYTMQLINKRRAFSDIQDDLKDLKTLLKSSTSKRKLLEIFKKLHQHKIGEEYMEIYDVNFERIHHDFFNKLLKIDSKLSKRELRLCAFIKMNLTNKEIAPLLNISVRGVETARYRVRKKLNIDHDSRFSDFLTNL